LRREPNSLGNNGRTGKGANNAKTSQDLTFPVLGGDEAEQLIEALEKHFSKKGGRGGMGTRTQVYRCSGTQKAGFDSGKGGGEPARLRPLIRGPDDPKGVSKS